MCYNCKIIPATNEKYSIGIGVFIVSLIDVVKEQKDALLRCIIIIALLAFFENSECHSGVKLKSVKKLHSIFP
jgi:hypothetical protein